MFPSIFNDVIGPVMRGPSSSHSAASVRIGRLVHDLMGGTPSQVEIAYDQRGSLATTHESQGTDMGLYGGLLGWAADDERLPDSPRTIEAAGTTITIEKPDLGDPHPNTYRLRLTLGSTRHEVVALSTGGGMIEVIQIDGHRVSIHGDYTTTLFLVTGSAQALVSALEQSDDVAAVTSSSASDGTTALVTALSTKPLGGDWAQGNDIVWHSSLRPVLPVLSAPNIQIPFSHASQLPASANDRPLSDFALEYECARGSVSAGEVLTQADQMLAIMRSGVEAGLSGTEYEDRILGAQSGRFAALAEQGELLDAGLLNPTIAYVSALMEAKSAMHVIVAAPTAGSCATFPGAVLAAIDSLGLDSSQAQRALLAGGLIGVFITNRSTFAAEEGGCQAETGAGAAMAAAALVEMAGGSAAQSLSAASQSLQNVLGLICDPVGNRVEAPCLGRNVAGAANAISCANMALAGFDHVVPFDEVLDAHAEVSRLMARELRCTGLGGLATTPTAQRIELDLKRRRSIG